MPIILHVNHSKSTYSLRHSIFDVVLMTSMVFQLNHNITDCYVYIWPEEFNAVLSSYSCISFTFVLVILAPVAGHGHLMIMMLFPRVHAKIHSIYGQFQ